MLDVKDNLKIEHRKTVEKKQEFKFIGNGKRKKGQKLFALNVETNEVYEVLLVKKKALNLTSKKEIGNVKAVIDPRHPHVFSINKKNATRKLNKMINEINK